jgi:hypothetical protein
LRPRQTCDLIESYLPKEQNVSETSIRFFPLKGGKHRFKLTVQTSLNGDILDEKDRERVNDRLIHQYHYEHFSRTVILVLALTTEIDNYFALNNKPQLSGIWMTFIKQTEIPGVKSEAKEMYDLRYKNFLELP